MIEQVKRAHGVILDCGSGLNTRVPDIIACM